MLEFTNLQTPAGDGEVLIEPGAAHWRALVEANRRRVGQEGLTLAGRPVGEVRAWTRATVLANAEGSSDPADPDGPIIACGHQPAFVHPGVWAKQVAVRQFAAADTLRAFDLVVDNDMPHSATLTVPVEDGHPFAGKFLRTRELSMGDATAGAAYEGRDGLPAEMIAHVQAYLQEVLPESLHASAWPRYLDGFAQAGGADFVTQHLAGRRAVDGALQADLPQYRVSGVFGGPFVADLLLDAPRFAKVYNDALARYRQANGVRGTHRPLPDLGRVGDRVETAFWIYQPGTRRQRLWISREGDVLKLFAGDREAGTLAAEALARDPDANPMAVGSWRIRPRALTLTLWARLLACDLFVHGIGGAKYDRITDDLFRGYFGCEPPAFACVSATLRLPLPRYECSPADLAHARYQRRDLEYNPDRYIADVSHAWRARRQDLIAMSDRLRAECGSRVERHRIWRTIREQNEQLLSRHPAMREAYDERIEWISACLRSNRVADHREFFYVLQPLDRLSLLGDTLRSQVSG